MFQAKAWGIHVSSWVNRVSSTAWCFYTCSALSHGKHAHFALMKHIWSCSGAVVAFSRSSVSLNSSGTKWTTVGSNIWGNLCVILFYFYCSKAANVGDFSCHACLSTKTACHTVFIFLEKTGRGSNTCMLGLPKNWQVLLVLCYECWPLLFQTLPTLTGQTTCMFWAHQHWSRWQKKTLLAHAHLCEIGQNLVRLGTNLAKMCWMSLIKMCWTALYDCPTTS